MKQLILFLCAVLLLSAPVYAVLDTTVVSEDFESGTPAGVTMNGGAAVVADPAGGGNSVLYIPQGGSMVYNDEAAFDTLQECRIAFDVYIPADHATGWWDMTVGKDGDGSPRILLTTGGDGNMYLRAWADLDGAGGRYNLGEVGAWGAPLATDTWVNIAAEVVKTQMDDGTGTMVDVKALNIYINGAIQGQDTTLNHFGAAATDTLAQNDLPFQVGFNNGFAGYVDNLTYETPEPASMLILGLGAALLRRRK